MTFQVHGTIIGRHLSQVSGVPRSPHPYPTPLQPRSNGQVACFTVSSRIPGSERMHEWRAGVRLVGWLVGSSWYVAIVALFTLRVDCTNEMASIPQPASEFRLFFSRFSRRIRVGEALRGGAKTNPTQSAVSHCPPKSGGLPPLRHRLGWGRFLFFCRSLFGVGDCLFVY